MTDPPQAARACADVPSLLYTCYITIKSCVSGIAFIFVATTSSTTPPIPGSTPPPPPPCPTLHSRTRRSLLLFLRLSTTLAKTPPTFTTRRMRRRPPPTIPTTSRSRPSPLTTLPAPASPQPVFPRKAMRKSLRTPRGGRQRHHPLSRDAEGPKVEVAVTEALIRRQHTFPAPPALDRAVVAAVSTVTAAPRTVPPTTLSISWAVTTRRSRISRRR